LVSVLPIAGQKFPQYFEGYLEFFAVFQNLYLFIPRFLAEPLTFCGTQGFRGTLVGKHCLKVAEEVRRPYKTTNKIKNLITYNGSWKKIIT
jgi:hypothetical protein